MQKDYYEAQEFSPFGYVVVYLENQERLHFQWESAYSKGFECHCQMESGSVDQIQPPRFILF